MSYLLSSRPTEYVVYHYHHNFAYFGLLNYNHKKHYFPLLNCKGYHRDWVKAALKVMIPKKDSLCYYIVNMDTHVPEIKLIPRRLYGGI